MFLDLVRVMLVSVDRSSRLRPENSRLGIIAISHANDTTQVSPQRVSVGAREEPGARLPRRAVN